MLTKAILFDFFGTLVHYNASRTQQGFLKTHKVLCEYDDFQSYEQFLNSWSEVFSEFDTWSKMHEKEFLMRDVVALYASRYCKRAVSALDISRITEAYIEEWETGISYIGGIKSFLKEAKSRYRLGIVSNTHYPALIHNHLKKMEIDSYFSLVITSAEVGHPKPHPAIFAHSLSMLSLEAHEVLFVGDSLEADFIGSTKAGMIPVLIDETGSIPAPQGVRIRNVTQTLSWLESARE